MNKKGPSPKNNRPLQPQRSVNCVLVPDNGTKTHPPVESLQGRTPHSRRKFIISNQIHSSVEICSRFEKLSGRSGSADPTADGLNKHSLPGSNPPQPV